MKKWINDFTMNNVRNRENRSLKHLFVVRPLSMALGGFVIALCLYSLVQLLDCVAGEASYLRFIIAILFWTVFPLICGLVDGVSIWRKNKNKDKDENDDYYSVP